MRENHKKKLQPLPIQKSVLVKSRDVVEEWLCKEVASGRNCLLQKRGTKSFRRLKNAL